MDHINLIDVRIQGKSIIYVGSEKMYENGENGKSLSYGKRIKSSIHSSPFLTAGINLEEVT